MSNIRPPEALSEGASHVFQMSAEFARRAEHNGPGSALATVRLTRRALSLGIDAPIPKDVVGRRFRRDDLSPLTVGILEPADRGKFVELIGLAGADRYVLEDSPSPDVDSAEFVGGFSFEHVSASHDRPVQLEYPRIAVADAFVQDVSSVQILLETCSAERDQLIICCRGASDDVQSTLALNRARGSLRAYLLVFAYDEDDANTLVDIATLAGTDVLSTLKGELLTSLRLASLPRLRRVVLRRNSMELSDPALSSRSVGLVARLRDKISSADELIRPILEARLSRLAGNSMVVRLANAVDRPLRRDRWDLALRSVTAATRGVSPVEDGLLWPRRELVPTTSVAAAVTFSTRLAATLRGLAAIA